MPIAAPARQTQTTARGKQPGREAFMVAWDGSQSIGREMTSRSRCCSPAKRPFSQGNSVF